MSEIPADVMVGMIANVRYIFAMCPSMYYSVLASKYHHVNFQFARGDPSCLGFRLSDNKKMPIYSCPLCKMVVSVFYPNVVSRRAAVDLRRCVQRKGQEFAALLPTIFRFLLLCPF